MPVVRDAPPGKDSNKETDDACANVPRVVVERAPEPPPPSRCGTGTRSGIEEFGACQERSGQKRRQGLVDTPERQYSHSPGSLSAASEHDAHFSRASLREEDRCRVLVSPQRKFAQIEEENLTP